MVSGTMGNLNWRANKLWAMVIGLRAAFGERGYKIELETKSADVVRKWDDWPWFVDNHYSMVVQQL